MYVCKYDQGSDLCAVAASILELQDWLTGNCHVNIVFQ